MGRVLQEPRHGEGGGDDRAADGEFLSVLTLPPLTLLSPLQHSGGHQPSQQPAAPQVAQTAPAPDYSAQWADYYR